jgi:two-component system sensor histidine kinase YesM
MDRLIILTSSQFERIVQNRVSQQMMTRNLKLEKDLAQKQADITYLQNQINPHFLYNTLECIRGQALKEGMTDLADTVQALGLFFRYNISVKGSVVSFNDELNNLQNYIKIQQYRFRNRFSLIVDFNESDKEKIKKCRMPKLCLQPIVENSILHAFNEMISGGRITLKAYLSDDNLNIIVADNGSGMSTEKLNSLNKQIHSDPREEENSNFGIGLRNVHRRIQLLFGNEYGLSVKSFPGIGTFVEILLPARTELTEDEE